MACVRWSVKWVARVRVHGRRAALAESGRPPERRPAGLEADELLPVVHRGRRDQAGRALQAVLLERVRALGVLRVAALSTRAVEALEHAQRDGALERVRLEVRIA